MTLTLLALLAPSFAATLTVDPADSAAYAGIQDAIDAAASGDTVAVAAGTYVECIDTLGKDLTLRGAGADATLLDGDGACTNAITIALGETVALRDLGVENRKRRGIYLVDSSLSLDGVRVEGAGSKDTDELATGGGGLYASGSAITVTNSVFSGNRGAVGGAIHAVAGSSLTVVDSTFSGNDAEQEGGAIYAWETEAFSIEGSTFDDNEARRSSGGAVYVSPRTMEEDVRVEGNTFTDNRSPEGAGGGLAVGATGTVQVLGNRFQDNSAEFGGAFEVYYSSFVEVRSNFIGCNTASKDGGGIYVFYATDSARYEDNVFVDNTAEFGGGIFGKSETVAEVVNNTFVGNAAAVYGGAVFGQYFYTDYRNNLFAYTANGDAVYLDTASGPNSALAYNAFFDNTGADAGGFASLTLGVDGNVGTKPDFVRYSADGDCSNDDLSLADGSGLVDAGDPDLTDADGSPSDIGATTEWSSTDGGSDGGGSDGGGSDGGGSGADGGGSDGGDSGGSDGAGDDGADPDDGELGDEADGDYAAEGKEDGISGCSLSRTASASLFLPMVLMGLRRRRED